MSPSAGKRSQENVGWRENRTCDPYSAKRKGSLPLVRRKREPSIGIIERQENRRGTVLSIRRGKVITF